MSANLKTYIEKNSGLTFCIALILGIAMPLRAENASDILVGLMILLLYISFLNVDVSHVKTELRNPRRLGLQIFLNFFVVPVVLFYILQQFNLQSFAVAALLLAAMPAGLGGPVFTGIAGGRVATSVVLAVVTHIMVPLSVPFLFWAFAGVNVDVNVASLAKQLALLICIPIILAYISRTYLRRTVQATRSYHKITSILALAGVAYFVIVPYAETIRSDFLGIIPLLIGTYIFYAVLCLTSFLFAKQRKPDEQAATVISRIYMNNALAIVLAFEFFTPEVTLITILAEIPWFTTFGAYLWFQKRFIGL